MSGCKSLPRSYRGGWLAVVLFAVVSLQHEYGIFGGAAGEHILTLLSRLRMPVVTTLHTVLATPTESQRSVLERIIALSARVIVMAKKGAELLQTAQLQPSLTADCHSATASSRYPMPRTGRSSSIPAPRRPSC